jgi:S-adenosylmethionine synthetase
MVVLAGEVTSSAAITPGEIESTVRKVICDIGYNSSDVCFDGHTCAVINAIGLQSPDIAMGTLEADEANQGAGDQGLMFGYAADETATLMPAPIFYSHRLVERQAELRRSGQADFLGPDAKSQISLNYDEDGKPLAIDAVVLSTQHSADLDQDTLREFVKREIIEAVLPRRLAYPGYALPHKPNRTVHHWWSNGRLRPYRTQDHC